MNKNILTEYNRWLRGQGVMFYEWQADHRADSLVKVEERPARLVDRFLKERKAGKARRKGK